MTDKNITQPKKNNTTTIIMIVVIIIFFSLLVIGGIGYWAYNKYIAKPIKNAQEGNFSIGDVSVNANQNWPTNLPSYVPKFSSGKIEGSAQIGDTWTITISNITETDYNNYKETLKNSGWNVDSTNEIDLGSMKNYTAKNDKNYTINCSLTDNENTGKTMLIGITLENLTN